MFIALVQGRRLAWAEPPRAGATLYDAMILRLGRGGRWSAWAALENGSSRRLGFPASAVAGEVRTRHPWHTVKAS